MQEDQLQSVLTGLAMIPLLCIGLAFFFPEKRLREQPLVRRRN